MGRLIGIHVLDVLAGMAQVRELFSTRGWGAPYSIPTRHLPREPRAGSYHRKGGGRSARGIFCDGSRLQPHRDLVQFRPMGSTRHLQRHGWYRRQQEKLAHA